MWRAIYCWGYLTYLHLCFFCSNVIFELKFVSSLVIKKKKKLFIISYTIQVSFIGSGSSDHLIFVCFGIMKGNIWNTFPISLLSTISMFPLYKLSPEPKLLKALQKIYFIVKQQFNIVNVYNTMLSTFLSIYAVMISILCIDDADHTTNWHRFSQLRNKIRNWQRPSILYSK